MLAGARLAHIAALVLPQHLGMRLGEPHRRRSGSGRQIHGDARFAELVDDAVEPAEVPAVLGGLDAIPAKNRQGTVLTPACFIRRMSSSQISSDHLVGIVVATERYATSIASQQSRPRKGSSCRHSSLLKNAFAAFRFFDIPYDTTV